MHDSDIRCSSGILHLFHHVAKLGIFENLPDSTGGLCAESLIIETATPMLKSFTIDKHSSSEQLCNLRVSCLQVTLLSYH